MDPPPSPTTTLPPNPSQPAPSDYPPPSPHPFSPDSCTLITQGAEALLYRTHFLTDLSSPSSDSTSIPAALKVRPSKPYRHEILDKRLTRQRVLAEARVLVKLSGLRAGDGGEDVGVRVPGVLGVEWDLGRRARSLPPGALGLSQRQGGDRDGGGADGGNATPTPSTTTSAPTPATGIAPVPPTGGAWLLMEWIEGDSVKDLLRAWDAWLKSSSPSEAEKTEAENDVKNLLRRIGRAVGAMHAKGSVVHGDLTTSNIMIRPPTPNPRLNGTGEEKPEANGSDPPATPHPKPSLEGEIVLIDFGLAQQSIQDEDRAVDLYVLERAFGSTHPRQESWFDVEVLQGESGYRGSFRGSAVVLKRLEEVRMRGRKRSMVG